MHSPMSVLCPLVIFLLRATEVFPLGAFSDGKKLPSPPIRRVAVIGAGIAGLSIAHALENSPECAKRYLEVGGKPYSDDSPPLEKPSGSFGQIFGPKGDKVGGTYGVQVSLFDSRPALDFEAGAGFQLNGGMSVLRKINPDLQGKAAAASLPLKTIKSRTKPWIDDGKTPFQTLLELNIEDAIRKTGGDAEKELIVDGEVLCYSIMRGALQELMLNELPAAVKDRTLFKKKLTGIRPSAESNGILCEFSDGSIYGPFDMVIGCDGINSAVKQYVDTEKISGEAADLSAIYSGIRISFAVQDGGPSDPPVQSAEFRQYFGDGAYALAADFGAGEGRPPTKCAFLIVRDEDYIGPFQVKEKERAAEMVSENADWTQNVRVDNREGFLDRVQRAGVPDGDIGPIIENADRFFELGVYIHSPFSWTGWKREVRGSGGRYCVLAGDGAHAMPPFLGQGSNQAVQDAYTLAKCIFEHNANSRLMSSTEGSLVESKSAEYPGVTKSLGMLLGEYEHVRWLPTASITAKATFLGYLETGQKGFLSKFRDAFFFVAGKLGIARKVFLDAATPKV